MKRRGALVALGGLVLMAILSTAGGWSSPLRAGTYQFLWSPELWGYGGYQALTGDVDGDGTDELVLQVMAGEYEGQEPAPAVITAVYRYDPRRALPTEVARAEDVGSLVAVADLDGNGSAEILAREGWDGPLRAWRLDASGIIVPASPALMEAYEARGGFLPGESSSVVRSPQDLNGDGLLDRVSLSSTPDAPTLLVETAAGKRVVPAAALLGRASGQAADMAEAVAGLADLKVEAWPQAGMAWPVLVVGARAEDGGVHLTAWVPEGDHYRLTWERSLPAGSGPYALPPSWALLELTGDESPELVVGRGGVLEVLAWRDGAFHAVQRTPDNGGLGWAGLFAADMDGDGRRELVARHVSPNLYTHHLKIYAFRGDRLEGLADLASIGSATGGQPVTWSWGKREVLLLPRQFEQARPEALGLTDELGFTGKTCRSFRPGA